MRLTFKTSPEWGTIDGKMVPVFDARNMLAVDLRWVSAIQPYGVGASQILMAGSGNAWNIVDMDYEKLLVLWLAEPKGWTDAQTAEMWLRADEMAELQARAMFPERMPAEREQCRREAAIANFRAMAFP